MRYQVFLIKDSRETNVLERALLDRVQSVTVKVPITAERQKVKAVVDTGSEVTVVKMRQSIMKYRSSTDWNVDQRVVVLWLRS